VPVAASLPRSRDPRTNRKEQRMNDIFVHRRPYRRGDFDFVARPREGAYWRSPDGLIVRIASGEGNALPAPREGRARVGALALLLARTARS
jgi:hypothetical protein